jgi:hypothetical protein
VTEVELEAGRTVVRLEHPLGELPQAGSTVLFGPWVIETVRHVFAPVATGDPRTWRGIEVSAEADGAYGVVALAVSAYREDVPGFIFGAAGWGGHGYDEQLAEAFSEATHAWMALSKADIWLQAPAQQASTRGSMDRYAAEIAAALPACNIVWLGETEHGNGVFDDWHEWILQQGPVLGFPALSLLTEPRLGAFLEQLADGLRADNVHYSAFGNVVLAKLWTEQLDEATNGPGCGRIDMDGDGALTFFDFLIFSSHFSAGDLRADIDAYGSLTMFDFLMFQSEFDRCGA